MVHKTPRLANENANGIARHETEAETVTDSPDAASESLCRLNIALVNLNRDRPLN